MKATELRIGNWVRWNYEESSEGNVYPVEYGYELDDIKNNPNIVKPIPLTEEWLVKFGFEKIETMHGNEYRLEQDGIGGFILEYQDDYSILISGNEHDMGITPSVKMFKYVHQLQNLYFALTGEEL